MADDLAFKCRCNTINWVSRKDIEDRIRDEGEAALSCFSCSRINISDGIKKSNKPGYVGNDYIHCIDFTGQEAQLPVGTISVGGKTLYVNVDGRTFTREEWKQKYNGADPAEHIIKRIKMHKIYHDGRPNRRF